MTSGADWIGVVLAGRYRIVRTLGQGGMGAVYEGVHLELGRPVAVKVLQHVLAEDHEHLARFRREATAAAALGHPHIAQVFDFHHGPGEPAFLVMELVPGRSLFAILREEGPLPPPRAVALAAQVLTALEAAHAAGIVHRDLKPGNVMVANVAGIGEVAKVVDFGIAKLSGSPGHTKLTQTGALVGTPAYMAPEQAMGGAIDGRADLYAMGVLLYRLLSARMPFEGADSVEVLQKMLRDAPTPLAAVRPDVPPALAAAVHRALEKRPDDRWQSAREMREALLASLAGPVRLPPTVPLPAAPAPAPPSPAPVAPAPAPAPRRSINPLVVLGACLLGAILVGSGAMLIWLAVRPRAPKEDAAPATAASAGWTPPPAVVQPMPAVPAPPPPPTTGFVLAGLAPRGTMRTYLPRAQDAVRMIEPELRLESIMGFGVGADGAVDITRARNSFWTFTFVNPTTGREVEVDFRRGGLEVDADGRETSPDFLPDPSTLPDSDQVVARYSATPGCPAPSDERTVDVIYSGLGQPSVLVSSGALRSTWLWPLPPSTRQPSTSCTPD